MTHREGKGTDFRIEPLGRGHDRAAFSCGISALDDYLKRQARQDIGKRVAICFVLTPNGHTIAGFYTLSQYSIDLVSLPEEFAKRLPKYRVVPATLLGRLAVSQAFRGQKLGEFLLLDALDRALQHSRQIASAALVVDAKDDDARRFYLHFDFISIPNASNRLFLPMATIEALLGK